MRPGKIKRVAKETFAGIKGLLKQAWVKRKRQHRKKPSRKYKIIGISKSNTISSVYEPSGISNVYESDFWRWRRVAEWEKYINDPLENKKWTQYNLVKYTSRP